MKINSVELFVNRDELINNNCGIKYGQQSVIADNDRTFFKPVAEYILYLLSNNKT